MRRSRWLQPLLALFALMYSTASQAGFFVGISVGIAPPPLPVYVQPFCPGPDFIWTPGYWAYDPDVDDYYWVPGTWVRAPVVGYLWTPGYWGWSEGYYVWHAGYWGPHVGFYGGINYGFGYIGEGYHGGYWNHGAFVYNTAVTNVNTTIIHNTYNKTVVVNNTTVNNVSFNGGQGGVATQPTTQEKLAAAEQHAGLTQQQTEHEHGASQNQELRASFNHGTPTIAATSHAAMFTGQGVVPAKGLTTGPKAVGTATNPALGVTPQGSLHHDKPANTFANVPPNGSPNTPKNAGSLSNPALGVTPQGSLHHDKPANTFANVPPSGSPNTPKNAGSLSNPALGVTPQGSLHHDKPANTFANVPPSGSPKPPKNPGSLANPALGVPPPGSVHAKHPDLARLPQGRIVGPGHPPSGPQVYRAHPQEGKKPPKEQHEKEQHQ